MLDEVQTLAGVAQGIEGKVPVDPDGLERTGQRASPNEEAGNELAAGRAAVVGQRQPLATRRKARGWALVAEARQRKAGRDRDLGHRPTGGRIDGGKPAGPSQRGNGVIARPVRRRRPQWELTLERAAGCITDRDAFAASVESFLEEDAVARRGGRSRYGTAAGRQCDHR